MAVNAGLAYGKFIPAYRVHRHPVLPLYVIGRWHGRQTATGDGSGGTVQASLCPENLPSGYPQDFFFTVYQLLLKGAAVSGDQHTLDGYSDDWIAAANARTVCQITGADSPGSENLPSSSSIPFWLSWVLRRVVDPGGNQVGAIKATWETNVNLGAYILGAEGLVLMDGHILPDFIKRLVNIAV